MRSEAGASRQKSRSFASDRRAWLLVLVAVTGTVAFVQWWNHRRAVDDPVDAASLAVPDWRLATLALPRVDAGRLEAWFQALRDAEFHVVTIEQVEAALAGRAGLPARALLLTFDDSRVATFDAADPLLRRLGWTAVMNLDPERQRDRDTRHVSWHRLGLMIASGAWRLGAKVDRSVRDPAAGTRLRVAEIRENLPGERVAACVGERCGSPGLVALADDPLGVTGALEARGRPIVWRLVVPPDWTAAELVAHLEAAIATPPYDAPSPAVLRAGTGVVERRGRDVTLTDPSRADVWLPGLRFADDWDLQARIRLEKGQIWLVREGPPGRTLWRAGLDGSALYLQETDATGALRTRARRPRTGARAAWGLLRVVKRGPGLLLFWNGAPLAETAVTLTSRLPGRLGLVAASDGEGARAVLTGIVVTPLSPRVVSTGPNPGRHEVRRLAAAAATISGVSPEWIEVGSNGLRESALNRDLFAMLAHRHAWDLLPAVVVRDATVAARREVAEELARRAVVAGYDGVRLDLAGASAESASAARDALERALVARHLRVIVSARAGPPKGPS